MSWARMKHKKAVKKQKKKNETPMKKLKRIRKRKIQNNKEVSTGVEMNQVIVKIEKRFDTCMGISLTLLQNASSRTRSHMMIGLSSNSKEKNNTNKTMMTIKWTPTVSKPK